MSVGAWLFVVFVTIGGGLALFWNCLYLLLLRLLRLLIMILFEVEVTAFLCPHLCLSVVRKHGHGYNPLVSLVTAFFSSELNMRSRPSDQQKRRTDVSIKSLGRV